MIERIRSVEKSIGSVSYSLNEKGKKNREHCRSLFFVKDIKAGEVITPDNTSSIRPGFGLHPKYLNDILGKKVNRDIKLGTPVDWSMIE